MALRRHSGSLLLLWLFTLLSCASAQQVEPSNGTIPQTPEFVLSTSPTSDYHLQPLTDDAGRAGSQAKLDGISITGPLIWTTDQNAEHQVSSDIAYISCDASAYPGHIDASTTINTAVKNSQLLAIVFFSTYSSHCSWEATNGFTYSTLYTMISAKASLIVQDVLSNSTSPIQSTIKLDPRSLSNNGTDSGNPLGKSPTTAVAMIILYSITGIITALFLIIIVVGAIRAHRHPERYGPRTAHGRSRQSRARGIARAMLETLPIVKFGDSEEEKATAHDRDIELASTINRGGAEQQVSTEQPSSAPQDLAHAASTDEGPEAVRTETAPDVTEPVDHNHITGDANVDTGLACSVCVDDFVKGQDIRVLPCKHKFHPECIDPWLLNVSGTCPLCRIDLRPTTSRQTTADNGGTNGDLPGREADITEASGSDEALGPLDTQPAQSNAQRRRSRNPLSSYLQHHLNIGRMREATPEERLATLRRLRSAEHTEEAGTDSPAPSERPRNRLSARLSRALESSRRNSAVPGTEGEQSEAVDRRRVGSYAG